jgi:hypothetical protein
MKKDSIFSYSELIKRFDIASKDPSEYQKMAEVLKLSADIILQEYNKADEESKKGIIDVHKFPGLYKVYLMLIGYAIENLLKGIYLANGGDFKGWKEFCTTGHELIGLITAVNELSNKNSDMEVISLGADETELLELLTFYIKFKGRYPTALQFESRRDNFRNPYAPHHINRPIFDIPLLNKLYDTFMTLY